MKKNKLTFGIVFVALAAITGIGASFLINSESNPSTKVVAVADNLFGWKYNVGKYPVAAFPLTGSGRLAYSSTRDPGGIPDGLPARLKIPIIGVDSAVEDAFMTPEGRMDVPAGSTNVAWFALGPPPGEVGSAVIGGHFGERNGVPFVFYNLDKLSIGDKIFVLNDKDETLQFVVRSIKLFDRQADATEVFTSDDGIAHLNLITCEGVWNEINGFYPQRRVVFTDLVPQSATQSLTSTFDRVLSEGQEGADVAVLQELLEQKGILKLPTGTEKGYFDKVTHNAVARYQTSVGLPASGVFGAITLEKLVAEKESERSPDMWNDTNPLPVAKKNATEATFTKRYIAAIKNLFATPTDTLITVSLLLTIFFVFFAILYATLPSRSWLRGWCSPLWSHEKKQNEQKNIDS